MSHERLADVEKIGTFVVHFRLRSNQPTFTIIRGLKSLTTAIPSLYEFN